MPKPEPPVEAGNALSISEFTAAFLPELEPSLDVSGPSSDAPLQASLHSSSSISASDLDACFQLLEASSAADYAAAGMGWKPGAKRREMKLPDMRYVVVRGADTVLGFASFMLTYEDGHEVVYLYEIHLAAEVQGRGLGRRLMQLVEQAGRRAGMAKTMLTVFGSNGGARAFYERLGYGTDEFSPEPRVLRGGVVKQPDYFILSKALP